VGVLCVCVCVKNFTCVDVYCCAKTSIFEM